MKIANLEAERHYAGLSAGLNPIREVLQRTESLPAKVRGRW